MMKKYMPLFLILFIILLMTITNPTKQSYNAWLKEEISEQAQSNLGKDLTVLLGDTIIDSSTKSKDFVILTYYNTKFDGNELKAIGLLKNFMLVNYSEGDIEYFIILILVCISIAFSLIFILREDKVRLNNKKDEINN